MCWALSDGSSKLVAIDEQPNHQIVHLFRLGKANGATYEPLNPRPQIDMFALDFRHLSRDGKSSEQFVWRNLAYH